MKFDPDNGKCVLLSRAVHFEYLPITPLNWRANEPHPRRDDYTALWPSPSLTLLLVSEGNHGVDP